MAGGRTTKAKAQPVEAAAPAAVQPPADDGFAAEFRELARQRRFVREGAAASEPKRTKPGATAGHADQPPAQRDATRPAATASTTAPAASPRPPRISEDQRAMLAELSRMSDRLVDAREQLAIQAARALRAEADLAVARDQVMAARALVHEAQRATRESAERCALLEGRCDALQEALEFAVNASMFTRWRWRRQVRQATADA